MTLKKPATKFGVWGDFKEACYKAKFGEWGDFKEACYKAKFGEWGDSKEACLLKILCPVGRIWRMGFQKQSSECGVMTLKKLAFSKHFVEQAEFGGRASQGKAQSLG